MAVEQMIESPLLEAETVRRILHADVDAFFASVELRDHPQFADAPFAVVTDPTTGVIASANYPARAYGIHGAMRVAEARRLCSHLHIVPMRAQEYHRASAQVFTLFRDYATAIQPGSLEEAFLDVGDRDPLATARELRRRARSELGLPLSIGIGRTKLIAKLASRRAKPDGVLLVDAGAEQSMRDALHLADVWGVGPVTRERLCAIGIHRVRDLDDRGVDELATVVGLAMARRLVSIALGTDDAAVTTPTPGRQISGERTVVPVSGDPAVVREFLRAAGSSALARIDERGRDVSRVEVLLTDPDRGTDGSRVQLPAPTADHEQLLDAAELLLSGLLDGRREPVLRARVTFTLAARQAPSRRASALVSDDQLPLFA
ncbi:DNA polymerase IV [Nakamurella sp. A5-74]|uniref:DNA polymerase IV n=1 Tax=Nakamurella sp. A5-74 TaxID=3158264 RepID=A0AAU8DN55_9ACTN